MLLHQRIDCSPPASQHQAGRNEIYLKVPVSTTFWTVIEKKIDEEIETSQPFPSRVLKISNHDDITPYYSEIVISGVLGDTEFFNTNNTQLVEYRFTWKLTPTIPERVDCVFIPLKKSVNFGYSYGKLDCIGVSQGTGNVFLEFDPVSKILNTSWYVQQAKASWHFGDFVRKHLISGRSQHYDEFIEEEQLMIEQQNESWLSKMLKLWCCRF